MFFFFLILLHISLLCECFLNTKYKIQLDYSIPSSVINFDKPLKYTNITIGKDSFLCILNSVDKQYYHFHLCENNANAKKESYVQEYTYVESKLKENYLLSYIDNINYRLDPSEELKQQLGQQKDKENSPEETDIAEEKKNEEEKEKKKKNTVNVKESSKSNNVVNEKRGFIWSSKKKNERELNKQKEKTIGKKVKSRGSNNISNDENDDDEDDEENDDENDEENEHYINCNFKKIYDYIFYKHKFHVYHKNRIYGKITDEYVLKNHIIKGKMLTINNNCLNVVKNSNILKICINKSVTYVRQADSNKFNKNVTMSPYLKGQDLLFANNTVVQYYTDENYFFEVLYICSNNNLKINSFEKLERLYNPLIFEIFKFSNMNLTKLFNIIRNNMKYKEDSFFKTYNMYTYSDKYYKTLKNRLNEMLNSYFVNVNYMYRITLSAYMFCNYTDKVNPPIHYLLRNIMNKCYTYNKSDTFIYEICLPYSVIKYRKDSFGKVQYPILLLGASLRPLNEGKPFFDKTYEQFPVLKYDYVKMKNMQSHLKARGNNLFDYTFDFASGSSYSSYFYSSASSNFPRANYVSSSFNYKHTMHFPYVSASLIDKPMEILKYGDKNFYKAVAINLKGEKCKDSFGEIHNYITTIYFDCSLHFKNENYTKVVNVFQTTECHYYIHVASPFMCAHPILHTTVPSKHETIKCFKNVHAASSQIQSDSEKFIFNGSYEIDTITDYSDSLIFSGDIERHQITPTWKERDVNLEIEEQMDNSKGTKKKKGKKKGNKQNKYINNEISDDDDENNFDTNFLNDQFISTLDKIHLYEFYALKQKTAKNKKLIYLESVPLGKKIIFGQTYDFGFGNYIRKRVYKNKPLYHIGNVVQHKYWGYHAVVVSWDIICYAPKEWKDKIFSEYPAVYQNIPHYLILVNKFETNEKNRIDEKETTHKKQAEEHTQNNKEKKKSAAYYLNQITEHNFNFAYVPESSLIYGDQMIYNEYLPQFFEKFNNFFHFYIPKKNHILWKLFPFDFFNLVS